MGRFANNTNTHEYRLALVDSPSGMLMTVARPEGFYLPRLTIPRWTRHAEEINEAIRKEWRLKTIVLSFLPSIGEMPTCAVAEVIPSPNGIASHGLVLQPLESITPLALTSEQRISLDGMIAGTAPFRGPFSRLGWFREAQDWIQRSVKDHVVEFSGDFRQYNAGDTFVLLHLSTTTRCGYWLKATGEPNIHEFSLTVEMSRLFPQYQPLLIAAREDWNAWVTEDGGRSLGSCTDLATLSSAVEALAGLQIRSLDEVTALKAAGCMDRSLSRVRLHLEEMVTFLEEAMQAQTSTKVSPLTPARLREIAAFVREACDRMQDLAIPDCLVNGDINLDNILFDGEQFRFTDWAEGGIGNPFLMLQQMIQHVIREGECLEWVPSLCEAFKRKWLTVLEEPQIDGAFRLMPLLTIADYLYGRGDWLHSTRRNDRSFQSFARTLARCMDQAAIQLSCAEVLQ